MTASQLQTFSTVLQLINKVNSHLLAQVKMI